MPWRLVTFLIVLTIVVLVGLWWFLFANGGNNGGGNGGAFAPGHPIGASGARVRTTLLYAMKDRDAQTGLATLCLGGGDALGAHHGHDLGDPLDDVGESSS